MKPRKTLSSRLTNGYLLVIRNEENFSEKTTFSFNYAKLLVFLVTAFIIFLTISLYLAKTILAQWMDPRYAELETNRKVLQLVMEVDSLEQISHQKDLLIANINYIISGEESNVEDYKLAQEDEKIKNLSQEINLYSLPSIDSQFRKEFEDSGEELVTVKGQDSRELSEIYFFQPLSGIVSSTYNAKLDHYGVDVVSKKNEPIKSVADGTVIFSSWTQDAGYVIAVQHRSNLISIYKHNSALLKKIGHFVNAGEIISIIGNTGELTTG
ncbi:MAG: M23 family metallopeptidase, partial [Bacteroidota bacterium]|nr:M23 family metallopeptidase [Bacteroidota bacterium]